MSGHTCPAPGCEKMVPADRLACPAHWWQLPPMHRRELWAAWRARWTIGGPERHYQTVLKCVEWWRDHG